MAQELGIYQRVILLQYFGTKMRRIGAYDTTIRSMKMKLSHLNI